MGSTEPYWLGDSLILTRGPVALYGKQADSYSRGSERTEDPCAKEPDSVEMMKTFGGSATPVDWGELYTALQSNVVDGAENNSLP